MEKKLKHMETLAAKLGAESNPEKRQKLEKKLKKHQVKMWDLWECFDVSAFWRGTGKIRFPNVAKAAMVALSAPSAESIAERVFSKGKVHKSNKQTRMEPRYFEASVIVDMDGGK